MGCLMTIGIYVYSMILFCFTILSLTDFHQMFNELIEPDLMLIRKDMYMYIE